MVENTHRSPVASDERGNPTRQWEVFVRSEEVDPLSHVGSVAAAGGTAAHEHATRLFGWDAVDVWLCPADSVERYSTRGLADAADERDAETADDGADRRADPESDEPRVYEETEGSPEVRDA